VRDRRTILHGSSVAWAGRAALILGPSGAGKSALALDLMSRGADLVADDRTEVFDRDGRLIVTCPATITGLIEARGIGILRASPVAEAELALVIDLSAAETERVPPPREFALLGHAVPLVHRVESGHFPAAVLQYLKAGRIV
jgi:HPr kinase/phosphorylase